MPTQVITPVGRLVWGHPAKTKAKTDQRTRQPILKEGKPVEQWAFGIAYSKADFSTGIWPAMSAEIRTGYPNGPPQAFAYKYKDGDTNDRAGKPYSTREGYAGNIVLTVSTEAFAPPIYKFANGQYVQMQPHEMKTGDYVVLVANLQVNVPPNGSQNTPSIYINPVAVLHVGYGAEIMNVVDPTTLFGQQPQFALPPGASLIPLAPPNMPGMPGTMPALPGPGYPQPSQGYAPPPDPRFTGAPQAPPAPQYAPPAGPPQYAPPGPPQGYAPPAAPPAYDFIRNAGGQYAMPPAPPAGPPQYAPPGPPQGYAPPAAPPAPGQMPGYVPPGPPQYAPPPQGYAPPAAPPQYAPPGPQYPQR